MGIFCDSPRLLRVGKRGKGRGARDEGLRFKLLHGWPIFLFCFPSFYFRNYSRYRSTPRDPIFFSVSVYLFSVFLFSVSPFATPQRVIKIETNLGPEGWYSIALIPTILLGKPGNLAGGSEWFRKHPRLSS